MTTDLKTSLLVNRQVPEFVRDEYPKFIAFLEAYYEFLEQKQGTEKNDLVTAAKNLRTIKDVDDSIDEFEQSFYNTYGLLIPADVQSNKALLFKHLVDLYKTKGAENSFKLLFQLVFGEDIEVVLPKNNVLKASASKWTVDNKLRINADISSVYDGDGKTTIFVLAQPVGSEDVIVRVNGVEKINLVDFYINKEYRQLIFFRPPVGGEQVSVTYVDFDFKLLTNRKVTGLKSGASAIVEDSNRRIISDTFNLGLPIELLINLKSLRGEFLNGEIVSIPIIDSNEQLIEIRASTFSVVKKINVIESGGGYAVGDKIVAFGGNATSNAIATVSEIFTGVLSSVLVNVGGAIFTNSSPIVPIGNGIYGINAVVDGIDTSGANSANSFVIATDIIASFNGSINAANTLISCTDYGFSSSKIPTGENASTRIIDALSFTTLQVGPITNVKILSTTAPLNLPAVLDAFGAEYGPNTSFRTIKSLGSIGDFKINDGGQNYVVGDEVIFGANPPMTFGYGAAAIVGKIDGTGKITRIDLANSRITGTVSTSGAPPTSTLQGTGTSFFNDLKPGDIINVNGDSRMVATITSDTVLSVKDVDGVASNPFTRTHTNQKLGVYNYLPLGGVGYVPGKFPAISVQSATGTGASVEIKSIASDGENLLPTGNGVIGSIISIDVVDPGSGYEFIPALSIQSSNAQASGAKIKAEIEQSYISTDGRWTTSDSIISSTERKIQGQDYYVDYSYLISSKTEFFKYKKLLKELLHPVGFVNYSEYKTTQTIERDDIIVTKKDHTTDNQYKTIGGRVNVGNGSVVVTGVNTKFNTAISLGIFSIGSNISVNGETRTVNSVISNTYLITTDNIRNINIVTGGSGYSNGSLIFSNGGGRITNISIRPGYNGSGYSNGIILFKNSEEGIPAIANAEVYASNGALRRVTLTSGGLYSVKPFADPFEDPHLVFYANTISSSNRGKGYLKGKFITVGGAPLREASISYNVYSSNGAINTDSITVSDSGLYESNVSLLPNTNPNTVIFSTNVQNVGLAHSNGYMLFNDIGIASITANARAVGVNSWITFTSNMGTVGASNVVLANARVFVNTEGYIENVTVYSNGLYFIPPSISNVYTSSTYYENTAIIAGSSYTNAVFTITPLNYTNQRAIIPVEVYPSNGSIRRVTISDRGLYANSTLVSGITVNSDAVGVNSWINLKGILGYSATANVANARVFVNTEGYIENVTIYANGSYSSLPEISNVYTDLIYFENTTPISTSSYTNAVFTIIPAYRPTTNGALVGIPNSYPIHITSVAAITPTLNGVGHSNGYVVFSGGDPVINANATIEVYPANGVIRSITVANAGLYRSAPTARANSVPVSITEVLPYVPDFGGRGYSNGYLKIVNGGSNVNSGLGAAESSANVQVFANGTGSIIRVQINSTGVYANGQNIVIYPAVESITANAGAVAVNSWITFSYGTPDAAVNIANARVFVNTAGYVQNVTLYANGIYTDLNTNIGGPNGANVYTDLKYVNDGATVAEGGLAAANGSNGFFISTQSYTNAVFTITMGPVLYHFNGVTQGKVAGDNKLAIGARFGLAFNSNTSNLANLVVSTTANGLYTGNIAFTANSNVLTNAVFTTAGVANTETIAIIDVDFVESNIPAIGTYTVNASGAISNVTITSNGSYYYPPTIRANNFGVVGVTANAGARTVNSFITFYGTQASSANARVYVNTAGYVINVTVSSKGTFTTEPIANISGLRYVENNSVFSATSNTDSNAVFTVVYDNAILSAKAGAFTQTANLQTAIFN
jgi:hypothetical protein